MAWDTGRVRRVALLKPLTQLESLRRIPAQGGQDVLSTERRPSYFDRRSPLATGILNKWSPQLLSELTSPCSWGDVETVKAKLSLGWPYSVRGARPGSRDQPSTDTLQVLGDDRSPLHQSTTALSRMPGFAAAGLVTRFSSAQRSLALAPTGQSARAIPSRIQRGRAAAPPAQLRVCSQREAVLC